MSYRCRAIFKRFYCWILLKIIRMIRWTQLLYFTHYYIITWYLYSRRDKAIITYFIIVSKLKSSCFHWIWLHKLLIFFLFIIICSKENTSKKPSINCSLINHNWIFLIISSVTSNCHNWITTWWKLFKMKEIHWSCSH